VTARSPASARGRRAAWSDFTSAAIPLTLDGQSLSVLDQRNIARTAKVLKQRDLSLGKGPLLLAADIDPRRRVLRRAWAPLPEPAMPAYPRLRMHRKRPQVLGVYLNRSESGRLFSVFDFQDFSSLFGKPCSRFANRCSGFSHGGLGQSTLVGSLGVARKLGKAGVASDRPDLVRGAASLGQTSGCGLSQSVRRAVRKPRLVTFAPEPSSKRPSRERATNRCRQER